MSQEEIKRIQEFFGIVEEPEIVAEEDLAEPEEVKDWQGLMIS